MARLNDIIRVLHVLGTGKAGGVETFVSESVRTVNQKRFAMSVCILGKDGGMADQMRQNGTEVTVLHSHGGRSLRLLWGLSRALFPRRFDIVHVHVGGRMTRLLAGTGAKGAMIAHVHGLSAQHFAATREGRPLPGSHVRRVFFAQPRRVLACSELVAGILKDAMPANAPRVGVLQYGVDTLRFQGLPTTAPEVIALRNRFGFGTSELVAGFVGRLVEQKGIRHLVRIAEELVRVLPEFRLVVIGDGPLRAALVELDQRIPRGRLQLLGERLDVHRYLPACDLVFMTSQWEAFGLILLEAMACARPVVGFGIDGVSEAVVHGQTGLLVKPENSRAFVEAVLALSRDPSRRRYLGEAGRARIERQFTLRHSAERLEQEYDAVLRVT